MLASSDIVGCLIGKAMLARFGANSVLPWRMSRLASPDITHELNFSPVFIKVPP